MADSIVQPAGDDAGDALPLTEAERGTLMHLMARLGNGPKPAVHVQPEPSEDVTIPRDVLTDLFDRILRDADDLSHLLAALHELTLDGNGQAAAMTVGARAIVARVGAVADEACAIIGGGIRQDSIQGWMLGDDTLGRLGMLQDAAGGAR